VEDNRDDILGHGSANEEEQEDEQEPEEHDAVEAPRLRLGTPPQLARRLWSVIDEETDDEALVEDAKGVGDTKRSPSVEGAKDAKGGGSAKRRRQSSRGGEAKPRLPRARVVRAAASSGPSAGGASSSGPSAGWAPSSGPYNAVQKAVDAYIALDANREESRWRNVPHCADPELIWYTNNMELWLGGISHVWDVGNIPQYATADRVPEGGSIGLMGRD
jgi:hypothetical protein